MPPKWGQVRQFCERQGYRKSETDHTHYTKPLPDHGSSGTMISHGGDGDTIAPSTWHHVWKHQLRLADEAEFWNGLEGSPVRYDIPPAEEPRRTIPDYLRRVLRDRLHLAEDEISRLSRDEAQQLVDDLYSREILDD